MNADIVVDVGNTRMKWGRCRAHRVTDVVSLAADDPAAWHQQWQAWGPASGVWGISGSHPQRIGLLADWLRQHHQQALVLDDYHKLLLDVRVDQPEKVGMDRLFNALAVRERCRGQGPAVIIDAGSAVTVDYVDAAGAFRGGAIFPGLRLMAQALHAYTAQLPAVNITVPRDAPGTNTSAAIEAGVYHAVLGGIEGLVQGYEKLSTTQPRIFMGGGDAALFAPRLTRPVKLWRAMTLEGIRFQVDGKFGLPFDDDEP